MEQSKNRYELILGFVTLIISFSAFKDELKVIEINLGFYKFTLADYLLNIVWCFGVCMYLYIIERISRQSKTLNSLKAINYIEKAAFILFVFIILTPVLLYCAFIIYQAFDKLTQLEQTQKSSLTGMLTSALGITSGALSFKIAIKYYKTKNNLQQEKLEKEEIIELENAVKLFDNGFYSQAILDAFKVLELHLIRLFVKNQINIPPNQFSFNELINYSIKLNLLNNDEIRTVQDIREMRNSAAHLNVEHNKYQATKTLDFIKYLIHKTSSNNSLG